METTQAAEAQQKYLELLAREFPTREATVTEIINLQAILNLPKGTEHFMSDLHGEYEAFYHILNNCSGVIREKVDLLFASAAKLWRASSSGLNSMSFAVPSTTYPANKSMR